MTRNRTWVVETTEIVWYAIGVQKQGAFFYVSPVQRLEFLVYKMGLNQPRGSAPPPPHFPHIRESGQPRSLLDTGLFPQDLTSCAHNMAKQMKPTWAQFLPAKSHNEDLNIRKKKKSQPQTIWFS